MSSELLSVEDNVLPFEKNVEQTVEDDKVLNVFVHSTSGPGDAWSDEEVDQLLSAWREVLEVASPPLRKSYNVARRVVGRLLQEEGGLARLRDLKDRRAAREEVRRQMKALRKEYTVYKGMQTIEGLRSFRHDCVDQLEHILDRIPQEKREADQSRRRRAVSEGGERISQGPPAFRKDAPKIEQQKEGEEVAPKPRFQQRRTNLTRLVRVMVSQQQTMLELLERLFKVLEVSNLTKVAESETPAEESATQDNC